MSLGHLGLLLSTKTFTDTFGLNIKKKAQTNKHWLANPKMFKGALLLAPFGGSLVSLGSFEIGCAGGAAFLSGVTSSSGACSAGEVKDSFSSLHF